MLYQMIVTKQTTQSAKKSVSMMLPITIQSLHVCGMGMRLSYSQWTEVFLQLAELPGMRTHCVELGKLLIHAGQLL